MSSLIVAASPLAGHTHPLLHVGGQLRAAGHDVTFLGGERFLARAEELGMRPVALTGLAGYDDRRLAVDDPVGAALPPGPERINSETVHVFADPIPDQHAALQELLEEDPERALITDILFAGAFPAACGAGRRPRRWVSLGIAPVYVRSVDTTPFGPAPLAPGQDAAAANLAGFDAFSAALQPAFEHVMSIVRDLGGRPRTSDWVSTLYELPDVVAQLSVPEFEFPRSDLPDSIRYVGILPLASPTWEPPPWWRELEAAVELGRRVVLVTQGTLANDDLGDLVVPTLQALEDRDALVIAALGRPVGDLDAAIPANARVTEYVPFDRLLEHVDVLVTNGGYGATQQALAAGVPVVVAGVTEDKPATAARVAHHRVGIDLGAQRPTPEQVRDAVDAVLGDDGVRDRTAALTAAYDRYDAGALIEALTEPGGPPEAGREDRAGAAVSSPS